MRHVWLLWLAAAVAACLPPLSVPPLAAFGLSASLVFCWVCLNVSAKQMFLTVMFGILDIFFREFVARNRFKVPPEGTPVIFICAPHANQFLDPFVVMMALGEAIWSPRLYEYSTMVAPEGCARLLTHPARSQNACNQSV